MLQIKLFSILSTIVALTSALEPIVVKNNSFYLGETNERFYIRGVDYQPGGSSNLTDPLSDPEVCQRDIQSFQDLGLNTIRVYSVDNTQNHTECMTKLEEAGIYVILDVNTPKTSISRGDAACSYNLQYLTEIFATIDLFAQYNNTLGFFSANELINDVPSFQFSPYVKAVTRDMKQYMRAQNYRTIPVGYSAADVSEVRLDLAHYLNCGDVDDERIDMLGVNDYSWCGHSSFVTSGYKQKMTDYAGYSIPIFLSEFGCNKVVDNRPFTEIQAIYSTLMSPVFSGGLVYEYFEYVNHYGLVEVDNTTVTELVDYNNLKSMLKSTENPTGDGGAASYQYSECPTGLNFSIAVPQQPDGLTQLMKKRPDGQNYGFEADTQDSCYSDNNISLSSSSSIEDQSTSTESSSTESSSTTISSTTTSAAPTSTVSSISSTSKSKNNANAMDVSKSFISIIAFISSLLAV